jgi:hypothetical protein
MTDMVTHMPDRYKIVETLIQHVSTCCVRGCHQTPWTPMLLLFGRGWPAQGSTWHLKRMLLGWHGLFSCDRPHFQAKKKP